MRRLAEYVRDYVARLSSPNLDDAWHSLVEAGPPALSHVIDAFRATNDKEVKTLLIEVVGEYRSAEAVPFLTTLLSDHDDVIWKAALDSLVMVGGQRALGALAVAGKTATGERREWFKEAADQIMETCGSD